MQSTFDASSYELCCIYRLLQGMLLQADSCAATQHAATQPWLLPETTPVLASRNPVRSIAQWVRLRRSSSIPELSLPKLLVPYPGAQACFSPIPRANLPSLPPFSARCLTSLLFAATSFFCVSHLALRPVVTRTQCPPQATPRTRSLVCPRLLLAHGLVKPKDHIQVCYRRAPLIGSRCSSLGQAAWR